MTTQPILRMLKFGDTKFRCLPDFSGPVTVEREGRAVQAPTVVALSAILADALRAKADLIPIARGAVLLPACDLREFLSVADPGAPSLPSAPTGYEPTCDLRWASATDHRGVGVFVDEFGKRWRLEQRWRQADCAEAWVPVRAQI